MDLYTPTDSSYDYAIGGLPFLSAASLEAPHRRETAPYRKDQFDQSSEAGEQSLSFWWSRSQASFHSGAGQRFLDGGDDDPFRTTRFDYSRGLDVWTPGELKPLRAMAAEWTQGVGTILPAPSGAYWVVGWYSSTHGLWKRASNGTVAAAVGLTGEVGSVTYNGYKVFVVTADGVWMGNQSDNSFTKIYTTPPAGITNLYLYWLKDRLIAFQGGKMYELPIPSGAEVAWPAASYTHPQDGYVYFQGAADGPSGFYVAAYGFYAGTIYYVGITDVSGVPTLGSPVEVARLPSGEDLWSTPHCLASYLNKYLLVATDRGVRVAKIADDGALDMGPLTLDPEVEYPDAWIGWWFGGFAVWDRFAFVACMGMSRGQGENGYEVAFMRIDLGQEIADGRFAWAQDQATGSTDLFPYSAVMNYDGKLIVGGDSSAVASIYRTTSSAYATDGYLVTSRIRFGTAEDKVFERLQISGEGSGGTVAALPLLNDETGTDYPSVALTDTGVQSAEVRIDSDFTAKQGQYVQVKLTISGADTSAIRKAKIRAYHLKALPAQKRQRVEQIPVLIFDLEKDRSGQQRGEIGSAYSRLAALEDLEEAGSVVTLQRFGPNFTSAHDRLCVVDRVEFVATTKPTDQGSGWGGIAMITVRMVD